MLFPLGDDNPTRSRPIVTWMLIILNAAVFVAFNLQMTDAELQAWTLTWGYDTAHPFSPQLFTSMFMHGGWGHILGNMWVLWIVGDNVEDKLGKLRFVAMYLLGGIAAALTFVLVTNIAGTPPEVLEKLGRAPPLVGASGAIAAVMGMYLVFFPESRIRTFVWFIGILPVRAKWFFGLAFAADLWNSAAAHGAAAGGVATMAHVGGGAFGMLAGYIVKPMVGGGGEGDAWEVHTGWAKRPNADAQRWSDDRLHPTPRMAAEETDELATSQMEDTITELVRAGRVREAIDLYPSYVAMSREQPLPEDVQIEVAHELYRQWLPKEAIPAYLRYLETYPQGAEAAEAKFRLGVLHARGTGDKEQAANWLSQAAREHRDPQIRGAAQEMLAKIGG